jgi:hypothetical protein
MNPDFGISNDNQDRDYPLIPKEAQVFLLSCRVRVGGLPKVDCWSVIEADDAGELETIKSAPQRVSLRRRRNCYVNFLLAAKERRGFPPPIPNSCRQSVAVVVVMAGCLPAVG